MEKNKSFKFYVHVSSSKFKSPNRQYFSLPYSLMNYITQSPLYVDGLQKLQKTCKYFFSKNQTVIVDRNIFQLQDGLNYFDKHQLKRFYLGKANWWLTGTLCIKNDAKILPSALIYRCTLNELRLYHQNLTWTELKFLINGGKIMKIILIDLMIKDENNIIVTIDRVLEKTPNILEIIYQNSEEIYTTETFEKLNSLRLNSKFIDVYLVIFNLAEDADISLLGKFIIKNSADAALLWFLMRMENSEYYIKSLKIAIYKELQNWNGRKKPHVSYSKP